MVPEHADGMPRGIQFSSVGVNGLAAHHSRALSSLQSSPVSTLQSPVSSLRSPVSGSKSSVRFGGVVAAGPAAMVKVATPLGPAAQKSPGVLAVSAMVVVVHRHQGKRATELFRAVRFPAPPWAKGTPPQ